MAYKGWHNSKATEEQESASHAVRPCGIRSGGGRAEWHNHKTRYMFLSLLPCLPPHPPHPTPPHTLTPPPEGIRRSVRGTSPPSAAASRAVACATPTAAVVPAAAAHPRGHQLAQSQQQPQQLGDAAATAPTPRPPPCSCRRPFAAPMRRRRQAKRRPSGGC